MTRRRTSVRGALAGLVATLLLVSGCTEVREPLSPELEVLAADLDDFWLQEVSSGSGQTPEIALVDGDVDTDCGPADLEEGSFFCAQDTTIYLQQVDLDDLSSLTAERRAAAQVYLVAHEYAHFLQVDLDVEEPEVDKGPRSETVRYELQADCLAGAFVADRRAAFLAAATDAVRASGDDVGEEPLPAAEYEHGSAAQRLAAFRTGVRGGALDCLTGSP